MSASIINQPWEDMADDVTGAIEKAVQPLLKTAVDSIYTGLLEATQDYLRDNLAFNIASRIDAAEREATKDRMLATDLLAALRTARDYVGDAANGDLVLAGGQKWIEPTMIWDDLAAIDAAIARAEGR